VVLIDFGACLTYPEKTLGQYRKLIGELYHGRRANFFAALDEVSGKTEGSFLLDKDLLWKYCELAASPLKAQDYDWGSTRLPDELYPLAMELVASSRIDTPPHDFIFLDRKILGLFSLLKSLRARFNVSSVSSIYLD
jgi:hypothetical protein